MSLTPKINFMISVSDRQNIFSVVNRLRAMGCEITNIMQVSGIIVGKTSLTLDELKRVPGVQHVEQNRENTIW